MSTTPLTYGSHVAIRIGSYWFSGPGNPKGCTGLSDSAGVGVSTSSWATYIINSPTKAVGDPVLAGDLFTLTDLYSNTVLQLTKSHCVLSIVPGSDYYPYPLTLSIENLSQPGPGTVLNVPFFSSASQPVFNFPYAAGLGAYYHSFNTPVQVGYLGYSTDKGGRVEVMKKFNGFPGIYVISQPNPGPGPKPKPHHHHHVKPKPKPEPHHHHHVKPVPPPSGTSKDILYGSIAVAVLGLGVVAYGYSTNKSAFIYGGLAVVAIGAGGGIFYEVKK